MKKILLCLLVLIGGVSGAGAAKLYIENLNFEKLYVYSWADENNNKQIEITSDPVTLYGVNWYVYEMPEGHTFALVKTEEGWNGTQTADINNISEDLFISVSSSFTNRYETRSWRYPIFRDDIDGNWEKSNTTPNGTVENPFTYSREFSKASLGERADFYFRFRPFRYDWNDSEYEISPNNNGTVIGFGNSTSDIYGGRDAGNAWRIILPTYDYNKIKLTATYAKIDGDWKWTVSADAYISKTVSGTNEYATFGTTVPVDLSAISYVTAYTLSADAFTGKITKTAKSDALAANEGVLLHNTTGEDVTLSIPVAASAEASSKNDLKAFTGDGKLTRVTETDYTNYILTKEDAGVGFYMVNSEGNNMGTNTAYLHVKDNAAGGARSFYFFDEEATGIFTAKANQTEGIAYNMNGQRVAQPTKGLYIVNGKKIVRK